MRVRAHVATEMARLLLPWLCFASAAIAAPSSFEWRAPAGCPEQREVVRRIEELRGGDSAVPTGTAEVTGSSGGRWQLSVKTAAGSRELETESCAQAAESAAVILALASNRAPENPRRAEFLGRVDVLSLIGVLPFPSAAVRLSVGVHSSHFRGELGVGTALGQKLEQPDGTGAQLSLPVLGIARACLTFEGARFNWDGCGALEAGALSGRGIGITNPDSGLGFWMTASLGGGAAWKLTPSLWVRAQAGVGLALARPRFVVGGVGPLYQPGIVQGRFELGPEWHF